MNPQEHVPTLNVTFDHSVYPPRIAHSWRCVCGIGGGGFDTPREVELDAKLHQMTKLAEALAGLVKEYREEISFSCIDELDFCNACTEDALCPAHAQLQKVNVALDAARQAGLEV